MTSIHVASNTRASPAEIRRAYFAAIDKLIVIRRAKRQSYSTIAKALGLANRNVVAGRIKRLREAGKVVP